MEAIEKFKQFIENIKADDKIGILHHIDADGLCSAVITIKALEKLGKKVELRFNQPNNQICIIPETIERLRNAGITKLFILDLAVHQDKKAFEPIENLCQIIVIDHHKPQADLNSEKTTVIFAEDLSKETASFHYPASKLCFDLFSGLMPIKEFGWIASIGIIGDKCEGYWKDFIKETGRIAQLREACEIIDSSLIYDEKLTEECFEILFKGEDPLEIINSELAGSKLIVNEEINRWAGKYKGSAEIKGDLIFYIIKPEFGVCSKVATTIHKLNPDKTVVVVQDLGNEDLTISARSRYYDMVDFLRKAIKGLEDSTAGGHKIAAGGKIRKQDITKFKEKLMELVE